MAQQCESRIRWSPSSSIVNQVLQPSPQPSLRCIQSLFFWLNRDRQAVDYFYAKYLNFEGHVTEKMMELEDLPQSQWPVRNKTIERLGGTWATDYINLAPRENPERHWAAVTGEW